MVGENRASNGTLKVEHEVETWIMSRLCRHLIFGNKMAFP